MSAPDTFPASTSSVPAARVLVCRTLLQWGLHEANDLAQMLVSELVTNAVLHARTEFTVAVRRIGERVRITVTDGSRSLPQQRRYGSDSTTGRGLRLVASLSADWGVDPDSGGKSVWFEVRADGATDATYEDWADEVDVDALLSAFDDDADAADVPTVRALAA